MLRLKCAHETVLTVRRSARRTKRVTYAVAGPSRIYYGALSELAKLHLPIFPTTSEAQMRRLLHNIGPIWSVPDEY